jgi:hypothetical protein
MMDEEIELHKGSHYSNPVAQIKTKAIVFDLDETIGQFSNLHELTNAFEDVLQRPLKQMEFDELLNMYPEFLRPGILTIMEFLEYKKRQGSLHKVYLYTNNQCGKEWVDQIVAYINMKIGATKPLFDDVIYAFKIKNQIVDMRRTTNNKTHEDLIKCTMMKDDTTEICFIDDKKYMRMYGERVYYIKPRPYIHPLSKQDVIVRAMENVPVSVAPFGKDVLHNALHRCCRVFPTDGKRNLASDIEITKKIMYYVREYLYFYKTGVPYKQQTQQTQKNRKSYARKTLKRFAKPYQKS